jgi:hypothetical protein
VVAIWPREEFTIVKKASSTATALTPKVGAIHTVLVSAFFRGFFRPNVALSPFGLKMFKSGRFM